MTHAYRFPFRADFNGDGKVDNITFMIKRIKIHTSNALKDTNYRFHGNYGVEKFLELFSGSWLFFRLAPMSQLIVGLSTFARFSL